MADVCPCHGVPWYVIPGGKYAGERRCHIKKNATEHKYYKKNSVEIRKRKIHINRKWRRNNPDKVRQDNERRISAGSLYLGRVGFTTKEREEILGKTD